MSRESYGVGTNTKSANISIDNSWSGPLDSTCSFQKIPVLNRVEELQNIQCEVSVCQEKQMVFANWVASPFHVSKQGETMLYMCQITMIIHPEISRL